MSAEGKVQRVASTPTGQSQAKKSAFRAFLNTLPYAQGEAPMTDTLPETEAAQSVAAHGATRSQRCRARRRAGVRLVTLELTAGHVAALASAGVLTADRPSDNAAIAEGILAVLAAACPPPGVGAASNPGSPARLIPCCTPRRNRPSATPGCGN